MKIEVYAVCYNEEKFIGYFLEHYSRIADRIFLFDNHSTDRTLEIARAFPRVEIGTHDSNDSIDEIVLLARKNSCWKGTDADWVIVCDIDELIWPAEGVRSCLASTPATVLKPRGYRMVSRSHPASYRELRTTCRFGVRDARYSKPCLFNPKMIKEMNFRPGCHSARPTGHVVVAQTDELKLLHYDSLGLERMREKHQQNGTRVCQRNRESGWSTHYTADFQQVAERYFRDYSLSRQVFRDSSLGFFEHASIVGSFYGERLWYVPWRHQARAVTCALRNRLDATLAYLVKEYPGLHKRYRKLRGLPEALPDVLKKS